MSITATPTITVYVNAGPTAASIPIRLGFDSGGRYGEGFSEVLNSGVCKLTLLAAQKGNPLFPYTFPIDWTEIIGEITYSGGRVKLI